VYNLNIMVGIILKLSYNEIGNFTGIKGGVCGTCFAVDRHNIATAAHVLSQNNFKPNNDFKNVQYWVLFESGQSFEIFKRNISSNFSKDLTKIYISKNIKGDILKISGKEIERNTKTESLGYIANIMPINLNNLRWGKRKIFIGKYAIPKNCKARGDGFIAEIEEINNLKIGDDIVMKKCECFRLSHGGIVGMSGGPVLDTNNKEVVGLMSFGLPPKDTIKKIIYAVSNNELIKFLST